MFFLMLSDIINTQIFLNLIHPKHSRCNNIKIGLRKCTQNLGMIYQGLSSPC